MAAVAFSKWGRQLARARWGYNHLRRVSFHVPQHTKCWLFDWVGQIILHGWFISERPWLTVQGWPCMMRHDARLLLLQTWHG